MGRDKDCSGLGRRLRPRGRACLACVGALFALAALAGCGASSSTEQTSSIEPPHRPSAEDCGFKATPSQTETPKEGSKTTEAVPKAGTYRYSTVGSQAVIGAGLRGKDLPLYSQLLVTSTRKFADIRCFRVQKRFAPDLANTSTYVSRGQEVYLVNLLIQALGESYEVRPNPPVLFASNAGSSWSGQFGGSTRGSYRFTALGKRTFRVGDKRLQTLGIASTVSYQGEVTGKQVATAWISADDNVVVREKIKSSQDFGVSTLRLHSLSRIVSPRPMKQPDS